MSIARQINDSMDEYSHDWRELNHKTARAFDQGRSRHVGRDLGSQWQTSKPDDGMIAITDLDSFQRNANSAGHVLEQLLSGGYLNVIEQHSVEDATYLHPDMEITHVGLSERAFMVLIAMGYVPLSERRSAAADDRCGCAFV